MGLQRYRIYKNQSLWQSLNSFLERLFREEYVRKKNKKKIIYIYNKLFKGSNLNFF